jgi:hypothetical protein
MKHSKKENNGFLRVNRVRIQFMNKSITVWGGLASIVAKLIEALRFAS